MGKRTSSSVEIVPVTSATSALATEMAPLIASAHGYAEAAVAPATRRGYQSDWRGFYAWCREKKLTSLPAEPQTVALYFTHLADSGKSFKTITRIAAAIRWVHSQKGSPNPSDNPVVRTLLRGIGRTIGRGARRQKAAATVDDALAAMVADLPQGPRGSRARMVLLLGFSGALRRSELASLQVEDVTILSQGATIHLARSKTDQGGKGADVAIPRGEDPKLCPVKALQEWIEYLKHCGSANGYLVRGIHRSGTILPGGNTDRTINRIVKEAAKQAGLDPAIFGAHSLRAGLATQAAIHGKNVMQIAEHGRWKRIETVLTYFRPANRFKDNAAKGIGL